MMFLWESYKEKYEKIYFLASLKSMKKGVGSGVGSGSISRSSEVRIQGPDPDPHQHMSRIPNTDFIVLIKLIGVRKNKFLRLWFLPFRLCIAIISV
jgi:hypothetical protein